MRLFIEAEADGVTKRWIEEFRDEARAREQVARRGFIVRVVREATDSDEQAVAAQQQQTPPECREPARPRSKPLPWYLCLAAMWLCLLAAAWCVYEATPQDTLALHTRRVIENADRVIAGLPLLPQIPPPSWNPFLLIAAGNSLFGALIFGTLAAIVRRVDELARKAA